uniref:Chemotaxis protein CheX n=1 Tax=Desulfacinum infernum TaxID=35837 RepID=A0A831ZZP0_9BACT
MDGNWQEVMKAAISEVLETMYFTDVVFQQKAPSEAFRGWQAAIEMHASDTAAVVGLSLGFEDSFARELAANMLGLDPDGMPDEDVRDALQELANMVAGNCVVLLGPEKWRLGLPRAHSGLVAPPAATHGVGMSAAGHFVGWAWCRRE